MTSTVPDDGSGSPTRRAFLVAAGLAPVVAGTLSRWMTTSETPLKYGATGASADAGFRPQHATGRAVQQAIDKAHRAGGGTVHLAAATYVADQPLHVRSGVALVGVGPASVIKAGPEFLAVRGPVGGHPLITTHGATDVTIARLSADHSGDVLDGRVPGRLVEYLIDGRHSTNLMIDGVHTSNPFTYSIAVVSTSRFCVRACSTRVRSEGRYDQLDGIHVLDSNAGDIVDNDVDLGGRRGDGDDGLAVHTMGGDCHGLVFRNNRVRGGGHGAAMQLAVGGGDIYDIVIRNNDFYGSNTGLHARRYGGGSVRDVTVGGGLWAGNEFRDNAGDAVDFTRVPVARAVVSNNRCVDSHGRFLVAGFGIRVEGNSVQGRHLASDLVPHASATAGSRPRKLGGHT